MKLSTSFLMIQEEKEKIEQIDKYTDYMHYDIMDGIFTENKTIDYDILLKQTQNVNSPKDVHLMVRDNKKYVDRLKKINPEFITIHLETMEEDDVDYIKNENIKVGIAINPDVDVKRLIPYLNKIDLVLVMSVKAGKGGQKFIDISEKIDYLYDYRKENNLNYLIEVDGGITPDVLNKVKKADMVVVGSFITNGDVKKQIDKLKDVYKGLGFTLIELLGVIIILSVLFLIATTAINQNINRSRENTFATQERNIIEAAKMFVTDNPNRLPNNGETKICININELRNQGYIDDEIINPRTGEVYDGGFVVIRSNSNNYTYDVNYNECPS